jgi:NAD(P)H dehydrogenase (quinone)
MRLRDARSLACCTLAIVLLLVVSAVTFAAVPTVSGTQGAVTSHATHSELQGDTPRSGFGRVTRAQKEFYVNDRIIVSGASGQLGRLVVKHLLARGVPAKNLILVSRTPEALQEFTKLGASTRFGDFTRPESLPAAFAGGTKMLLISIGFGAGPRPEAHKHAIDAAVAAGVKQIAYTSFVAISGGDHSGIGTDHYATEEILKKSGVHWTFLRNSIYQDVLVGQAAKMVAEGRAIVPANEVKLGYVAREDCAAAAAAVLSTPGHEDKAYDITGSELIGQREMAAAASAVTGRNISVSNADPNAAAPRAFAGPAATRVSTAVADLTGKAPITLRQLFEANKKTLLGSAE